MATRADPLSLDHVQALNLVLIDFNKNNTIIPAFNKYLNHLSSPYNRSENLTEKERENNIRFWCDKQADLLSDLLQKIGESLSYKFDIDDLKRGVYLPTAHTNLINEQTELRRAFIALTKGQGVINVNTLYTKEQQEKNMQMAENVNNVLTGKQAIFVKTEDVAKQKN
jgi:hypothetical protein